MAVDFKDFERRMGKALDHLVKNSAQFVQAVQTPRFWIASP